ncbi:hypothetical protein TARUN_6839 [Trichoderma arundinaceum]|uniref:Uncharacterized protein n=1 Tax=Trichoderma arundinaceum TaxID=490622 RepID=A0A395NH41_TRIAR|nr:hypothetical protein TARUN_6839 [Trichoderma arundinaceum]
MPFPANSDQGFMEPHDARGGINIRATAPGLSPINQHGNGREFPESAYRHRRPGKRLHDSDPRRYARLSPVIKQCYDDQFSFDLSGDTHYDTWSPNPTSAPSWFPSVPSPGLVLNNEWGAVPASLIGYSADNLNSEYEAQLPWPEPDSYLPQANVTNNFDDDVDPFGVTYYTPRGIDGILETDRGPETTLQQPLTDGGEAALNGSTQQQTFEGSSSGIPFRLDIPGQPATMILPTREEEGLRQPMMALAQMPTSMMLLPHIQTLNMPSPLSVISPPSSVKSLARKRTVSVVGFEKSPVAPKKRVIKPHMTTKVDNSEDFEIKKDSEKSPTGAYQGYFHTFDMAKKKLQRLLEMYRKPKENCSFPATDHTFPKCDNDKMGYIKDLFDAINDWTNFREWSQALKTDDRNRIIDRLRRRKLARDGDDSPDKLGDFSLDDMRPSQQELESLLPPLETQQKKILGRLLSDQTVEWLCWELVRVEAMCYALRKSKQLVKSLLSAGDGWKLRIANNPQGELGGTRSAARQKPLQGTSQK